MSSGVKNECDGVLSSSLRTRLYWTPSQTQQVAIITPHLSPLSHLTTSPLTPSSVTPTPVTPHISPLNLSPVTSHTSPPHLSPLTPHLSHLTPHISHLTSSPLSPVTPHTSPPHLSPLTPNLSPPHLSHLTPHLSPLTPHPSPVTPHTSPLTCHPSPPHLSPLTPHTTFIGKRGVQVCCIHSYIPTVPDCIPVASQVTSISSNVPEFAHVAHCTHFEFQTGCGRCRQQTFSRTSFYQ